MSNRSFLEEEYGVYDDLHELNYLSIEGHHQMLVKKDSLEKERQISVDPISLREPSFNLMLPPVVTSRRDANTVSIPWQTPASLCYRRVCSGGASLVEKEEFLHHQQMNLIFA